MEELISQMGRRPSKVTDKDLDQSGWARSREKVIQHLDKDPIFLELLEKFGQASNRLKFIQSTRDVKIYFIDQEKSGTYYTYARCFFVIDGKRKEFRKFVANTEDMGVLKKKHINMDQLKKIFLNMLKNYLEV
jgi:hypothetical protein